MKPTFKMSLAVAAVSAALVAPPAFATNGYFKIGYGSKNRGMAGAGVAYSTDSMAPATNPAGITAVGHRADFGAEIFNPRRRASLDATSLAAGDPPGGQPVATVTGANTGEVDSGSEAFVIPHGGFVMPMGGGMTFGFSAAANGGMNTRYNSNLFTDAFSPAIGVTEGLAGAGNSAGFAGALEDQGLNGGGQIDAALLALPGFPIGPSLGVNLAQLIMAPTIAFELNKDHSVGVSALIGYQQFRAYGLGLFAGFSSDPANLTNRGNDDAWGAGLRVGWTGKMSDRLTLGAVASSKIYMQEFDKYKGLFAEQGDFDIPANFAVGLSFKATDKTTVAVDVQRILYSGVASIANDGPTMDEFMLGLVGTLAGDVCAGFGLPGVTSCVSNPLGSDNGFGFGWDDITVVKLGVEHVYDKHWTFRGGVNIGENPIKSDQNLFNVLAPGVVEKHLTLGFTYSPDASSEITVGYMHAFDLDQSNRYTNSAPLQAAFGPQSFDSNIGMSQNAIEISYGMKF